MTDLLKKIFTVSVVAMTIVWSMGLATLLPSVVVAATVVDPEDIEAGDLITSVKDSTGAVYFITEDMERMYFPNEPVFKTWYANFDAVKKVDADMNDYWPTADNAVVAPRPGSSVLFMTPVSSKVYVMGEGNTYNHVKDEATAKKLFGTNWNKEIMVWPDYLLSNWTYSGETVDGPFNGFIAKNDSKYYQMSDEMWYEVDGDLPAYVSYMAMADADFDAFDVAETTVTAASVTADPAQTGATTGDEDTTPTKEGELTVSLSANNPSVANVADGTSYNEVLALNFKAGSEAVNLDGLTITRTGLIANANVTGVSVWDSAGDRHGEVMTSFNSDNKVTIGFASDPIIIAANDTEEVLIKFNLGTSASGGTVGAKLAAATDVDTDAEVKGSFPFVGNNMTVVDGSASLSAVYVDAQAAGGTAATTDSANVEVGETKEIGKFKVTETTGYNAVQVEKVTFYLSGTVDDNDLQNFQVYSPENEMLGETEWATDHYVTVSFDKSYEIPASKNRVLTLKATVVDGSSHYVRVEAQNSYDWLIKDKALGYYIDPTDSDQSGYTTERDTSTGYFIVKSGNVTLAKTSGSPSGAVAAGADDVVLAKFDVKAVGEDLEIRKIGIKITTASTGNYGLDGNVRLIVDGDTLLSFSAGYSAALYSTGSQRTLSQYLEVKSGQTKVLEVIGDLNSSMSNNGTVTVSIGNLYAKRMSTKDFADNLPSSAYGTSGNAMTINATSVVFVKDTSYGAQTLATGNTPVIGQFKIKAGAAEGICLTNVTVQMQGGGTFSAPDYLQNLALYDGAGAQLGSTVGTVATSSNSFSMNKCLTASEEMTLKVKAYLTSSASGSVSTTISSFTYTGQVTKDSTSDTTTLPGGQVITIGSANVIISAVNDSTTLAAIRMPSATGEQVGKWKLATTNQDVTLKRITFQLKNYGMEDYTSSGNFGTLSLYDSADMTTPLGTASYVPGTNNGYARFDGLSYVMAAGSNKYLVLKAVINPSGTMDVATMTTFVVKSDAQTDMEMMDGSGSVLGTSAIDADSSTAAAEYRFATSTWYLYHNAAPTISKTSLGTTLTLGTETKLLKFTVSNNGDRTLRLTTMTFTVGGSGLTAASNSTGTVGTWKLYEANGSGEPGVLLVTSSSEYLAGGASANVGDIYRNVNASSNNTVSIVVGPASGSDNWTDSYLTVDPGTSRTLILVADTSSVLVGKTSGTASVYAKLDGATGVADTDTDYEDDWADGVIQYHYTPLNGSENSNTNAYSASDSYDIIGDTLSIAI